MEERAYSSLLKKKSKMRNRQKTTFLYLIIIIIILIITACGVAYQTHIDRNPIFPQPISQNQEIIDLIILQLNENDLEIAQGPSLKPDNTIWVKTSQNMEIIFSSENDLNKQFLSLQLILKRVKMDHKEIKLIDLTLTSPHVQFKNN
jgi:hypothetical protein